VVSRYIGRVEMVRNGGGGNVKEKESVAQASACALSTATCGVGTRYWLSTTNTAIAPLRRVAFSQKGFLTHLILAPFTILFNLL
jgi:hypothetical protein